MPDTSETPQVLTEPGGSDDPNDNVLPLNRHRLTSSEVATVYSALLGRVPENQQVWTDRGALDSILMIAQSAEARAKNQPITELKITEGKFGTFVTYHNDLVIGAAIRASGQFEEDAVSQTLSLLKGLGLDVRMSTFLDIGANIGTHNIAALKAGFQKVVCVEADPGNFKLLKVNHVLNDFDTKCINVNAAISDVDGTVSFERSSTNYGDHRVKVDAGESVLAVHGEDGRDTFTVPARRLDTLLTELNIDPNEIGLAWIDTQGHEGHVASGGSSLLRSQAPLVMEFWPYGLHRSGGYPALRDALTQRSQCYDLRRSFEARSPVKCTIEDLDKMFDDGVRSETATFSPHTDLLIIQ